MVIVTSGKTLDGKPCEFYLDETLVENLDVIKKRVMSGAWDSKILVCGYSGVGKSHTTQFFARYLCPWFDHTYYCFSVDEFMEKCSTCPEYSSVVLDECFESMNSKAALSREFQKVISFLQIIRQRHLFIFLVLPNFFDLNKSVALYNSSLLVVCYDNLGKRGQYLVFDREKKKNLFIRGHKMMDYSVEEANIRGHVNSTPIIDWKKYEGRKTEHLLQQIKSEQKESKSRPSIERDRLISYCKEILGLSVDRLKEICVMPQRTIYDSINRQKDYVIKRFKEEIE